MKLLGRRGTYTLLVDDGTLPGERGGPRRRLWRARADRDDALVHVVDVGDAAPEAGGADPAIVAACFADARIEHRSVIFPYAPGVFLLDVIAQGAVEGGEVPVEAAVYVVAAVARAVEKFASCARRRAAGGLVERVRVTFDGDVSLWLFSSDRAEAEWYDDRIRVIPRVTLFVPDFADREPEDGYEDAGPITVIPNFRLFGHRRAPDEEAASPEEAEGGLADARSEVFVLGGLLWMLLTGAHPFARADLLSSLGALRAVELPPLARSLPPRLIAALQRALSRAPAARFASAADFAAALDDCCEDDGDGRAALVAVVRGLFPAAYRSDTAFVEEAGVVDLHALPGPLSSKPPGRVPVPGHARLSVSTHLVTQAQVLAWSDAVGVTLPPGFPLDVLQAHRPATLLPHALAEQVAHWLGGRLPSEDEFDACAAGGGLGVESACGVVDLCLCWEWTNSPVRTGFVVRGGPWRNREERGLVDNRSWEDEAAPDVGVRVYFDD